ncbi:MAG: hypothetical protein R2711_02265 [Acidimicrobiales bacterium]
MFVILYRTPFQLLNRQPFGYDMARRRPGPRPGRRRRRRRRLGQFGYFVPKHLDPSSALYHDSVEHPATPARSA